MNRTFVTYDYLAEELKEFLDAFEMKLVHNRIKFDLAQRYDEADRLKELDSELKSFKKKLNPEDIQ